MPQYYQQLPGQQFPGGGGQPMLGGMVGQTTPFLNSQLQPWTTGLFDRANDLENCVITFFCPCITFGQIAELADRGMTSCSGAGLIWILLLYFTGCQWVYSWMYRAKLRAAYSLPEDPCHDCLVHFCCEPCALCQEYRELKNRGFNMNLGWIGNMQLKAQQEAAAAAVVPPPVQGMIR
ncbi:cell number regulator 10-like isoform X2 [Carex rostrata]